MRSWPIVPLRVVLRHRKEFITIHDSKSYKRCRVQLHARGIVLRDRVLGADIKTKRQQVCKASDFLVAEIDAKAGGFGLLPDDLDGAVVSSHYFLFDVDRSILDPRFLDHYCRTEQFRAQVQAQGSTNYAAIRPSDVLAYTLPLPQLTEQRDIVDCLDRLTERTRSVEAHLYAAEKDAELLVRSFIFHPSKGAAVKRPMSTLVQQRLPDITVDRSAEYHFAGVYSFGRGVFPSVVKNGVGFAYDRLSTIHVGDFTYPKLMAWEGALGVVPAVCDGMVVSPEFPVFSVNTDEVLPEVLDIYFRTPEVWPQLAELSGGTNVRRRRLQPSAFLRYEMPVPTRAEQFRIRDVLQRIQLLNREHSAIRQANSALIPATLERLFSTKVPADA